MRTIVTLLLLWLSFVTVAAQGLQPPASSPSGQSPNHEIAVLKAQLETTKQFQDSFMSMAQWTLGGVIAVALALGAFAWHTNKTNYDRDKEAIQREAKALAAELRAEVQSLIQSDASKLAEALGAREQSIRNSIEQRIDEKLLPMKSKLDDVEDQALDLKESALDRDAEESLKEGNHRWATRRYCELLKLHVARGQHEYFVGDVLDKLRAIAKDPKAVLDADTITALANAIDSLPSKHKPASEPLLALFKSRLT